MKFLKYHSIENSYRIKTIDAIVEQGLDDGEFVVQEKAHGANLSFWYDGSSIKSAKRSGFIDDNFYDYEGVAEKYTGPMEKLYGLLKENKHVFQVMVVYGELIGGIYPHKDVSKDTSATRIQKGIFYSPHNDFYAIDMALDGQLLDIDTFSLFMEQTNFLYAKPIFKGTFQECMSYPNKFQSQIPVWLGLPEINDNCCEGIVIKPVQPKFFGNSERVVLKNKNEKWAEKAKQKKRPSKQKPVISDAANQLWESMEQLVTENRLRNVISKIGKIEQSDFGKLMAAFSKDALEDFNKDYEDPFKSLDKKEQKHLSRQLNNACSKRIRANFLNIIDGTF
ncbi:MAG: RNA ligase, Rnl2 family [Candidatus Magnetomorum sp.]|nr:RNA ligase, Rnl2 family [Candidatus Magnetomorum sp.]